MINLKRQTYINPTLYILCPGYVISLIAILGAVFIFPFAVAEEMENWVDETNRSKYLNKSPVCLNPSSFAANRPIN